MTTLDPITPPARLCLWCDKPLVGRQQKKFCSRGCALRRHNAERDRTGTNCGRYNGGLCRRDDGRWVIHCRDGTLMYFYRGVMAAHLGRLLEPWEIVHHRNEVVDDDRVENLEIVTRADHINIHREALTRGRFAA